MADNVTPFRRPPPKPAAPQQQGGLGLKTHRGKAVLAHLLAIAAFTLNLFFPAPPLSYFGMGVGIAAGFFSYANRGAAMPWVNTHHEHVFRTVIIGYSIWTLATTLTYIHGSLGIVTIFLQIAVIIWALIRSGVGLVFAVMRKPIKHPHGWLL